MPASGMDFYPMHDAKNNFDAIRPAPICSEANYFMGQCRNIHISTNFYYGYHEPSNRSEPMQDNVDSEMLEVSNNPVPSKSSLNLIEGNTRKRSAVDSGNPRCKRHRQEVQTMKSNKPETNEKKMDSTAEDLLATLYWHIHGGNFYQCV